MKRILCALVLVLLAAVPAWSQTVTLNPTQFTALQTNIDASEALLTQIQANTADLDGNTDGLETLLTSIRDNADVIEALLGGTAAASAENMANPTTGGIRTYPQIFDGSTWDRWTGAVTVTSGSISCSNCTGSGASDVEGSTFALGTDSLAPIGIYFDDISPTAATEDRVVLPRGSSNRNQYIQIRDGANNERGALVTANNELLVELGAGSASIGVLGANSGVDIGDVTVNNATIAVTQSGTWDEVGINDSGNSITVDGTVTANAGTGNFAVNLSQVLGATHSATNPIFSRPVNSAGVLPDDVADDSPLSGGPPSIPVACHAEASQVAVSGDDDKSDVSCNLNGSVYVVFESAQPVTQSGTWNIGTVSAVTAISNALPAGTNNIGDVDILSIAAGDNNIGNVDLASAIPAGNNNIGDVDVASIAAGDNDIGNVDLEIAGTAIAVNAGAANAQTLRVIIANDDDVSDAATLFEALLTPAHDDADAGNPLKVGGRAIAHGTNPTAVAAADRTNWYFNRAGVPFVIGGHPNVITREAQIEDADGAQTNAAIVTVSAGTKIVVTRVGAHCDASTTAPTNIVVGFATATLPARAAGGTSGLLAAFDGVPPGGGETVGDGGGIIGIGADDEDIRITTEDPAGGNCSVELSYYTIES